MSDFVFFWKKTRKWYLSIVRTVFWYSELDEKTYRRWFARKLDFTEFNQLGNREVTRNAKTLIAALDCSYIKKSGDKTYGLGKFFDSKQGKADKGLEISTLAVVDVDYNTAYHVSTRQTPPNRRQGKRASMTMCAISRRTVTHCRKRCVMSWPTLTIPSNW